MNLFILRHGIAVERGTPGYESDFDRPLTPDGEKKLRGITQAMGRLELTFDRIISSPYVRARQTAEIVAKQIGAGIKDSQAARGQEGRNSSALLLSDSLGAEANPRQILTELNRLTPAPTSPLLVGHEPYLSNLISLLIAGSEKSCVLLKKGGLCKLTVESLRPERCAVLDWLLTPKQMLRMK